MTALREAGHDVLWVRESAPGWPDAGVLPRAQAEERLWITFDKDFGELAFRRGLPASHGVVLFRIAQPSALAVARRLVATLASRTDWQGHCSVVEEHNVRMRPPLGR